MKTKKKMVSMIAVLGLLWGSALKAAELGDSEMESLVQRSYQYVALFNTLNNFAVNPKNPFATGGWNKTFYPTGLMDGRIQAVLTSLAGFLATLKATAEQLTDTQRLHAILTRAFAKFMLSTADPSPQLAAICL